MGSWGFYGRRAELAQLEAILARGRWFFVVLRRRAERLRRTRDLLRPRPVSGELSVRDAA